MGDKSPSRSCTRRSLASISRQRFLQEIQVAARLLHPHILPLFDSGESTGLPLVRHAAMWPGSRCASGLLAKPQLPIAEALSIAA